MIFTEKCTPSLKRMIVGRKNIAFRGGSNDLLPLSKDTVEHVKLRRNRDRTEKKRFGKSRFGVMKQFMKSNRFLTRIGSSGRMPWHLNCALPTRFDSVAEH